MCTEVMRTTPMLQASVASSRCKHVVKHLALACLPLCRSARLLAAVGSTMGQARLLSSSMSVTCIPLPGYPHTLHCTFLRYHLKWCSTSAIRIYTHLGLCVLKFSTADVSNRWWAWKPSWVPPWWMLVHWCHNSMELKHQHSPQSTFSSCTEQDTAAAAVLAAAATISTITTAHIALRCFTITLRSCN